MIRTGGGVFSITRICTVLVWLRSSSTGSPVLPAAGGRADRNFQRVPGRMLRRNVERLEVVPLVFDLGPVGHGEAQPAHDVFELVDRLRDRMQMPEPRPARRAAWDRMAVARIRRRRPRSTAAAGPLKGGFDPLLDFVKPLAGGRLVGTADRAELLSARS